MSTPEMVGGLPVVTASGTPRAMGQAIGQRLKSRLQVLAQYLHEQLASAVAANGEHGHRPLSSDLQQLRTVLANSEPAVWMELESMASAAEVSEEDLLLVYGYADLLSRHRCHVPPARSCTLFLTKEQCDTGKARLVHVRHCDPALFPYLTIVRRTPSNGPATLGVALAGMYPMAALSESNLAGCLDELRILDGHEGGFTHHLLAGALTAPGFAEAAVRLKRGPRQGGAAMHLLAVDGRRLSVELSGQEASPLADPQSACPRVHTNHALQSDILARCSAHGDSTSKERLRWLAGRAVEAKRIDVANMASWFGVTGKVSPILPEGMAPDTTVFAAFDPADRRLWVKRGGLPGPVESLTL
jgi:hypothetical protein